MNDWSRLAVDLHKKQKLRGRKQELHQYKYAPDKRRTGPRPVRKRELTNPTVGRRGEDNSVCPLTNTYHEWPVLRKTDQRCPQRLVGPHRNRGSPRWSVLPAEPFPKRPVAAG